MAENSLVDLADLIALLRKLIFDVLSRNSTDKAEIARIRAEVTDAPDEQIIQMARDTAARIDQKAEEFLNRLDPE